MATPVDRFRKYAGEPDENGCWIWRGSIAGNGYGRHHINYTNVPAHRFSYELHVGPVPDGLVLDHLCRNRACVNPEHLEPVTHPENCRRGFAKLTKENVAAIKAAVERGATQGSVADRFGINQSTVSRIVNGLRWVA